MCQDEFRQLALGNGFGLSLWSLSSLVAYLFDQLNFYTTTVSFILFTVGLPLVKLFAGRKSLEVGTFIGVFASCKPIFNAQMLPALFVNLIVTFTTRLLAVGAVLLGLSLGFSSSQVVEFSQILLISRVLTEVASATLSPLNVRISEAKSRGSASEAVALAWKSSGYFASFALAGVVLLFALGPLLYEIWTSKSPSMRRWEFSLISLTVALPLITSPHRFLLTNLARFRALGLISIVGALTFLLLSLLLRNHVPIYLGQFVGSACLVVLYMMVLINVTRKPV